MLGSKRRQKIMEKPQMEQKLYVSELSKESLIKQTLRLA